MELGEVRKNFVDYFTDLGYLHRDASTLIPQNDPSVLFTTAGMQQFKDFYQSPQSAPGKSIITIQPVFRTSDIGEVGDATHLTIFEMLGNFKFGEANSMAMKETAIKEAWNFIHKRLGVVKDRVSATVFKGDRLTPADTEAEGIWQSLGIEVKKMGRDDNFWGPTGDEGPCGPTSEIYIDGMEVWNLVFNEYYKNRDGKFAKLPQVGLDTGSGLERLAATLQGHRSVWAIETFAGWLKLIDPTQEYESKIIIDHLKAIIFLVSAGVMPANKGRDYILRRLIRKVVFLARRAAIKFDLAKTVGEIHDYYAPHYKLSNSLKVIEVFEQEKVQFEKNLSRAIGHLDRWVVAQKVQPTSEEITKLAFYLFESFGFPKELLLEHLRDLGWELDDDLFAKLFAEHQATSRQGSEGLFKGGLADHDEQTIKHHTAHHLLLAALRQVLGETVVQKGSNVTRERLRLDFNFDRKLTEQELKKVEQIVNEKIKEDLPVVREEMSKDDALKSGALAEFGQKYGESVTVYTIYNKGTDSPRAQSRGDQVSKDDYFSRELCGGPHIKRTGQLGRFEILKEEASSQGVRRIKARAL